MRKEHTIEMKNIRILIRNIRDGFKNVFRNISLSVASISCITVTLIIVAASIIGSLNVENFTKLISNDFTIVAFMENKATSEEEAKEEEEDDENKRKKSKFLGLIPAIGSVILFILTEDMRNKMIWTDKYTLAMVIILLVNFVLAYLTRNKKKDDDEEEDKPADPNQTVAA